MSASAAIATEVQTFPALTMRNNVARDIISRSSDFKSAAMAIFEYVANGYEAYDVGDVPALEITVRHGARGSVSVRDRGRGMDLKALRGFWTMHGRTERRDGGLNNRGYHGTGKIAAFAVARELRVESVRDGRRNVHVLTRDAVDEAVVTEEAPRVDVLVHEEPTDAPNGTVITVSRFINPVYGTLAREIADKVASEGPLWMHGAAVSVNGAEVEFDAPTADRAEEFGEGDFTARVFYCDAGFKDGQAKVLYRCGGVFIAMDEAGKEGHRFGRRVRVEVDTTKEWAAEHFNHCRERFVSEARDLRLKRQHPAAGRLGEFAERTVREFMAKLDADDRSQRRDVLTEALRSLEDDLSKTLSADWRLSSPTRQKPKERDELPDGVARLPRPAPEGGREPRETRAPKPRVSLRFVPFAHAHPHYRVDHASLSIEVNVNHPAAKLLAQHSAGPAAARISLLTVAVTAYAELLALDEMKRELDENGAVVFSETDTDAAGRRVLEMRLAHETRLLEAFGPRLAEAACP